MNRENVQIGKVYATKSGSRVLITHAGRALVVGELEPDNIEVAFPISDLKELPPYPWANYCSATDDHVPCRRSWDAAVRAVKKEYSRRMSRGHASFDAFFNAIAECLR